VQAPNVRALWAFSWSERKCSSNAFLVGYQVWLMGQKNGSARCNKGEDEAMLITLERPLPDEAFRLRVQFLLVLLKLGQDLRAPRGQ